MNTFEDLFSEYAGRITNIVHKQESAFIQYCKTLSSIIPDNFYVLDIVQKQFCYIKPNDLLLCGHSVEEAMDLGYDFFSRVIHPEDLLLWKSFLDNLPQKLHCLQENTNERGEFFCLLRLLQKYPFLKRPVELYTYHRLSPICEDSTPIYLIGIISYTNCKKIGCYLKENQHSCYQTFNHQTQRWQVQAVPTLSKSESRVLALAQIGQATSSIGNALCVSESTIQNHMTSIKRKLETSSLRETLEWISYLNIQLFVQNDNRNDKSTFKAVINSDIDQIQQALDDGKSIRSIARRKNISESTIRYWIKKGIVKR